jgi:hypothetical protein
MSEKKLKAVGSRKRGRPAKVIIANPPINWDFVRPLYRSGLLSNVEICRQYGEAHRVSDTWSKTVTESGIRRKAKADKWQRDLDEVVKEKTRQRILFQDIPDYEDKFADELTDQAAEIKALVDKKIKHTANELQKIYEDLIHELAENTLNYDLYDRVMMFEKATTTFVKIAKELRTAYNLDDLTRPIGKIKQTMPPALQKMVDDIVKRHGKAFEFNETADA